MTGKWITHSKEVCNSGGWLTATGKTMAYGDRFVSAPIYDMMKLTALAIIKKPPVL